MRTDERAYRRVAEPAERRARGERIRYLPFRGHRPRRDGPPGPGCLSQWWPAPFTVESVAYPTAEHWMMAAKARLFGDAAAEERVADPAHWRGLDLLGLALTEARERPAAD